MRVSIWQQFSSNHSGSFTVVGRFETEETAHEAANELGGVIRQIDEWHEDTANEAWYKQVAMNDVPPITPAEKDIQQKYAIEWEVQAVDWYGDGHAPIRQLGRDVFFSVGETWCSSEPIANLLGKLGAHTYEEHEFGGGQIKSIFVKLSCSFDSENAAKENSTLLGKWKENFAGEEPPWANIEEFAYAEIDDISDEANVINVNIKSGIHSLPVIIEWLKSRGGHTITYTLEGQEHFD